MDNDHHKNILPDQCNYLPVQDGFADEIDIEASILTLLRFSRISEPPDIVRRSTPDRKGFTL